MQYAISYSSKTGNTKALAEALKESLPQEDLVFYGESGDHTPEGELIYVGFWTDRDTCDDNTKALLKNLHHKKVFLFGTAGFGADPMYYEKILNNVKKLLDETVCVIGTFMCQGRMPMSVRERYEKAENMPHKQMMLDNFDEALKHPNEADLQSLRDAALSVHPMQ